MTEAQRPHHESQAIGATGRMFVFESSDGRSASTEVKDASVSTDRSHRYAVLEELAELLDEQTVCFVGKGRLALAALEAADQASAAAVRIILDTPDGLTPAHLDWAEQSQTLQRSDILILTGSATASDAQASARLVKSHLPRATLMFVYGAADNIARDRPELYQAAVQDFLRRGSGFILKI